MGQCSSRPSVGVRNPQRATLVLWEYSGRCPLLLGGRRGWGESQTEGTQSQAVRKTRRRQTTRTPRVGGPPREDRESPLRQDEPQGAAHAGSAPAARGPASRRRQRREEKERGGSESTVTPEPKCSAPEPAEPASGTRLPRRHVGRGQLPAGPAPAREGAGAEERALGTWA